MPTQASPRAAGPAGAGRGCRRGFADARPRLPHAAMRVTWMRRRSAGQRVRLAGDAGRDRHAPNRRGRARSRRSWVAVPLGTVGLGAPINRGGTVSRARPGGTGPAGRRSASELVAAAGAVDRIPAGAAAVVPAPAARRGLTPREVEVLRELVKGRTTPQIGEALLIAPHTVASHVKSIREKLGAPTRTAAGTVAVRDRLVSRPARPAAPWSRSRRWGGRSGAGGLRGTRWPGWTARACVARDRYWGTSTTAVPKDVNVSGRDRTRSRNPLHWDLLGLWVRRTLAWDGRVPGHPGGRTFVPFPGGEGGTIAKQSLGRTVRRSEQESPCQVRP